MIIISESVIRAQKENRKREIAQQIQRRDQLQEASNFRAKHNKSREGLLKSAKQKLSQVKLLQLEGQSKLAKQES